MAYRRLKHTFLRLSPEEKVAGVGILLVALGAFMPWFSVDYIVDNKSVTETGFTGSLGVIGFVVFLFTLMGGLFLVADHMRFKMPNFGYKKEQIVLFLTGESAFLLLLTVAIYTRQSFDFPNAEIRFGLYVALIGACFGTFAMLSLRQKLHQKEVESFFDHSEQQDAIENESVPPADRYFTENNTEETTDDAVSGSGEIVEDDLIEDAVMNTPEQVKNSAIKPPKDSIEEDTATGVMEKIVDHAEAMVEKEVANEEVSDQSDFFVREAGIENSSDKMTETEVTFQKTLRGKKTESLSMGFYED